MSLLIVGSVAFDTIETPTDRRERIVGGSATYSSLAASIFTKPGIVSVVGEDFPSDYLTMLKGRGVDISGLKIEPGKTFFWEGRYEDDPNLRTTLRTEVNVFQGFHPRLPENHRDAEIVFLGNIDPDLQEDILDQVKSPQLVAMDTISLWINTKPDALLRTLKRVNIFFGNDEEIGMLTGENNLIRAGKKLMEFGPSLIVMKKGEHGAILLGRNDTFGVLAHPCEDVMDPTGAGDTFAGGFLGYLDSRKNKGVDEVRKAAVYGSVLASFVIEDFGTERLIKLTRSEIDERFESFRRMVSF